MKKHITLILMLMSMCVAGIIGLQLFWNYQNYKNTVETFDHDINEAMRIAVDREADQRLNNIVKRFKGWLADTSLITITADHKNRDSSTVFHTFDTHPKYIADKKRPFTFGLADFTQKLQRITPQAKRQLIDHFGDLIVKHDLKQGVVYNYTQMLGDSLGKVFNASKADMTSLQKLYKAELRLKNIEAPFVLYPAKRSNAYLTKPVNTSLRKPYKSDLVSARFESPDNYFLKEMKWIIITSLLLIAITLACFTYTAKTLLSQQKLAQLKDDFINNMTHELNTPLSSIKITAEALKSFDHKAETQREYLEIITYQVAKLTDLTGQILNADRLIKNSYTLTNIDIDELIQKALYDLRPQFGAHNAIVNYIPAPEMPVIKGEVSSLFNAFVNVIDNALKYNLSTARVNIGVLVNKGYAELTFADNGIGIPPEYHQKVFEQFFRVPQGNRHNVKGYGLGLSYVNQVVRQHNGSVSVRVNKPCGSIITIKLPLS